MRIFEITVLSADDDKSPLTLTDRCRLEAKDATDAARKYAALFSGDTPLESAKAALLEAVPRPGARQVHDSDAAL